MNSWSFSGPNPIVAYAVGLELTPPLDPIALKEVASLHSVLSDDLPRRVDQQAFTFQVGIGQPEASIGGVVFDELDRDGTMKKQLAVMPSFMVFTSAKFDRWLEYWPLAERILGTIAKRALVQSRVSALVLAANNKFKWSGSSDELELDKLVRKDCVYVSSNVSQQRMPCHSFHGYTAINAVPPGKRIDNINFAVPNLVDGVPTVDLNFNLRLILDDVNLGYDALFTGRPESAVAQAFKGLHELNNDLFAQAIVPEICRTIRGLPEI